MPASKAAKLILAAAVTRFGGLLPVGFPAGLVGSRHPPPGSDWPKNEPAAREGCGFDGGVKARVLRLD